MNLYTLVKRFLVAEGYEVSSRDPDLLVGSRGTVGGDTEFLYAWVPKDPSALPRLQSAYLTRFGEINEVHPHALKFMIVPSLEGLGADFRRDAKRWFNVNVRVPVQFFDTPFTWEESPEAPSAAKELEKRGRNVAARRAPQPFTTDDSREGGNDLLDHLFTELRRQSDTSTKHVHVVVGPAGMGKSYLFDSLFARLHKAFREDKRRQELSARPMPLLPQNLRSSDPPAIRMILQRYLETDFARPMDEPVFEWMLTHGFAMWLLDGLDEVISQDPSFFDYLLDLMTSPAGATPPTILICVRDSLLATNEDLRDFCDEWSDHVAVHRLEKWQRSSKEHYASVTLKERAGEFLDTIHSHPALDRLAAIPFYCDLLRLQYEAGELQQVNTEVELLNKALTEIVARDYAKGFLDPAVVSTNDVLEFMETLAAEDLENEFRGVGINDARGWAELLLPTSTPEHDIERFISQLTQLAVFGYGGLGRIRFAQEVLEHYLIGRSLVRVLDSKPAAFVGRLATKQIPSDWITLRVLAEHFVATDQVHTLKSWLVQASSRPAAFKNVLQIAAHIGSEAGSLGDVPFERHDLSGLVFDGLSFAGVSFRGCDLTDTQFRNCILSDTRWNEAVFRNTFFELPNDEALRGAEVGDLRRFYSLKVGRRQALTTPKEASQWFRTKTGIMVNALEPCEAALQLRYVFGKFVHPNGQARRSKLDVKGVIAGKRYANPEKILNAAVRHGYLLNEPLHNRITRPSGDKYSEMIAYVRSLTVSAGLAGLIAEACNTSTCPHVAGAAGPE